MKKIKAAIMKLFNMCCVSLTTLFTFLMAVFILILSLVLIGSTMFAMILFVLCVPIYALFIHLGETEK